MIYFAQGRGRMVRVHIARVQDRETILLKGRYQTLCGATISPKKWGLAENLPARTRICGKCRGVLEKQD